MQTSDNAKTENVLASAQPSEPAQPAEPTPVLATAEPEGDESKATEGEGAKQPEPAAEPKPAEKEPEPAPAPEPELKIPDGAAIDPDLIEAAKAKDPQKVIDAFLASEKKRVESWTKQQQAWVADIRKEWGDKFDHNLNLANRALNKFGSKELVEFLGATGLANHPEIVRLFHRIGEADAEDSVAGTAAAPAKKDESERLRALYSNSPNLKF